MSVVVRKTPARKGRGIAPRGTGMPIELPEGTWERIRVKAHELWEARGRQEGNDLRDWLDAEEMVMEEIHEARE